MNEIEERANKVRDYEWRDGCLYHYSFKDGYVLGAKEQRAIDIDKACEWLEKYMESLGYIDEWCRTGEDKFKKAMEEL